MSIISWFEDEHPQLVDRYKEFVVDEKVNIVDRVAVMKGDNGPRIGTAAIEKTKSGSFVNHLRLDPGHESEIFGNDMKFGPSLKKSIR